MREQLIAAWKNLAATKTITAAKTLDYIILRADGDPEKAAKYIKKAFAPVRNPKKLANGRKPYDCLYTGENYSLQYITKMMPAHIVDSMIARRISSWGLEATPDLISQYKAAYAGAMKILEN